MQRLGKNLGRYQGDVIDIDAVQQRIHKLALAGGWSSETFLEMEDIRLCSYRRESRSHGPNIYIAAGIHGDEPSGPLTILKLFEENWWPEVNLWIVPCLNPTGFRLNTRENRQGIDLNRNYRNPSAPEVLAHIAWLQGQPSFELSLLLHEDWEANGFYIYELNPKERPSLAQPIIQAVQRLCPIESSELVDDFTCRGGVIRPTFEPTDRPHWAESIYLISHQAEQSYTLETPSDYPLDLRVQAHRAALREAFRLFSELSPRSEQIAHGAASEN